MESRILAGARTEEEIAGPDGLLATLTRRLIERAMEVELTDHLGYEPQSAAAGRDGEHPYMSRATYTGSMLRQDYVAPGMPDLWIGGDRAWWRNILAGARGSRGTRVGGIERFMPEPQRDRCGVHRRRGAQQAHRCRASVM